MSRAWVLPVLVLALPACERGCLATWLTDHGVGWQRPPSSSPASFPLHGVDCPDGLARCIGGVVEVSRVSHYETPCTGNPETCICPWDPVGPCPRGCAAEGTEVVVSPDEALGRLCALDPATLGLRTTPPTAGAPPGACESLGYRCIASLVVACVEDGGSPVPHPVVTCTHGCVTEGEALDDEALGAEAAVRILCAP